jgi:hypothetical protein
VGSLPTAVFVGRQRLLTYPAPVGAAILLFTVPSRQFTVNRLQMTKRDLENRARRLSTLLDGLNAELVRLPMEKEPMTPTKPTATGRRSSR